MRAPLSWIPTLQTFALSRARSRDASIFSRHPASRTMPVITSMLTRSSLRSLRGQRSSCRTLFASWSDWGMVGSPPAHFFKKSTDLRDWPVLHRPRALPRFTSSNLPCTHAQNKWPSPLDADSLKEYGFPAEIGSWPLAAAARLHLADPSNSHSEHWWCSEATDHLETDGETQGNHPGLPQHATAASSGELLGTTFSAARCLFNHSSQPAGKEKPTATSDSLTTCASHRKHWYVRRPRSSLVRPNVAGTMPEVLAAHRVVNAATAVTSPKTRLASRPRSSQPVARSPWFLAAQVPRSSSAAMMNSRLRTAANQRPGGAWTRFLGNGHRRSTS